MMSIQELINFAAILSLFVVVLNSQEIQVYKENYLRGTLEIVKNSKCVQLSDSTRPMSINTNGTCTRLYSRSDCAGWALVIPKGPPPIKNLDEWGFSGMALSVGPCSNSGDDRKLSDKQGQITLFEEVSTPTRSRMPWKRTELLVVGCTMLPNVSVYAWQPKSERTCFRLYQNRVCKSQGQYMPFFELDSQRRQIVSYSYPLFSKARSISLCDYNLNSIDFLTSQNKDSEAEYDPNSPIDNKPHAQNIDDQNNLFIDFVRAMCEIKKLIKFENFILWVREVQLNILN